MSDTPVFKRNDPVWFRKFPQTEDSIPNAIYKHSLGELRGRKVCKIIWRGEEWKVGEDEIKTTDQALGEVAAKLKAQIEIAQARSASGSVRGSKKATAKALGISETALRRRLKLVQQHLQQPKPEKAA